MEPARSVRFAATAHTLAEPGPRRGLGGPGLPQPTPVGGRPPHGAPASPAGQATVAVLLRDRPWEAVLADMIEGMVVANALRGPEADHCRDTLWRAVAAVPVEAAVGRPALPAAPRIHRAA